MLLGHPPARRDRAMAESWIDHGQPRTTSPSTLAPTGAANSHPRSVRSIRGRRPCRRRTCRRRRDLFAPALRRGRRVSADRDHRFRGHRRAALGASRRLRDLLPRWRSDLRSRREHERRLSLSRRCVRGSEPGGRRRRPRARHPYPSRSSGGPDGTGRRRCRCAPPGVAPTACAGNAAVSHYFVFRCRATSGGRRPRPSRDGREARPIPTRRWF